MTYIWQRGWMLCVSECVSADSISPIPRFRILPLTVSIGGWQVSPIPSHSDLDRLLKPIYFFPLRPVLFGGRLVAARQFRLPTNTSTPPPIRRTRACNNGSCIRSVRPMPCALFHIRRVTSKVFEIGVHGTWALTPFLSTQLVLQLFATTGDYRRIKGAGGGPIIRFCRLQCPGGQL